MAIADTITSMQTHTSNAYTMIGYGTDLTGTNKNLENLYPSIFNAFLEALRTPDTLFTNLPKITGSGSNITLNDTANAPMKIELSPSELTQDGTPTPSSPQAVHTISGDNTINIRSSQLIDFNNYTLKGSSLNYSFNNDTLIVNCENATYSYVRWDITDFAKRYPGKSIRFKYKSISNITGSGTIAQMRTVASTTSYKDMLTRNLTAYSYTIPNDVSNVTAINFELYATNSGTAQNGGFTIEEPLLCFNLEDTYSPYNDTDYSIDLSSKNLFNKNNSTSNYYLAQDGTPVSSANFDYTEYIPIKPNTYYLTIGMATGTGNAPSRCYYDKNKNFIIGYAHESATDIFNASPSNAFYMRESVKKVDIDTIKIYEAPYYDYGEYCKIGNYEDKIFRTSGKNLFDGSTMQVNKNINTEGVIGNYDGCCASEQYIEVEPNTTYTFSCSISPMQLRVNKYTSNKTNIERIFGASTNTFTFTTDSNCYYVRLSMYSSNSALSSNYLDNIQFMLNEGTTTLDYEPYGSKEWYIKKNIGKVVLDGSENWVDQAQTGFYRYGLAISDIINNSSLASVVPILSNQFKGISFNNRASDTTNSIYIVSNGLTSHELYINTTTITSLNAFKTQLGTSNLICYYVLATPTYTQITGTLETQLENVYQKMLSQKGQTNISQVNNDLAFGLSASALEDLR